MSDTAMVELMLRIDVGEEPPTGQIVAWGEEPVSFVGWLGLLRCLSDLVESARGELVVGGLEGELDSRGQPEL
jgi:hypothetical protein